MSLVALLLSFGLEFSPQARARGKKKNENGETKQKEHLAQDGTHIANRYDEQRILDEYQEDAELLELSAYICFASVWMIFEK